MSRKAPQGPDVSRGRSRTRSASKCPQPHNLQGKDPPPTRSWANIAKTTINGYDLSFIPPSYFDDKPVIKLSAEILEATDPKWHECLVRYYIGKKLPFKLTKTALKHAWGHKLVEVLADN